MNYIFHGGDGLNPFDGNEYDNDNILSAETLTDDEYTDAYDEKRGRSAVGRLFDDDDDVITPVNRMPARNVTPVTPVVPGDDDYLSALASNRNKRGDRSRPVVASSVASPRKIERPGVRNPEPKPAMRARVAVTRESVPTRHMDDDHPIAHANIGDDLDTFKNRYGNRDALGTARDPGNVDRNVPDDRVAVHTVGAKPRQRTSSQTEYSSYQSASPIRWLAMAGLLGVLIVMIVLVVHNMRMSSEIDDLNARLAAAGSTATGNEETNAPDGDSTANGTPAPGGDSTSLQLQLQAAREELEQANERFEILENWVRDEHDLDPDHAFNPPVEAPEPPPTTPDPTDPPLPPPHQYHTVTSGQTLSEISRIFYNNPNYFRFIAEANGISAPYNVFPGDVLVIPRR